MSRVIIVGYGHVGKGMHDIFADAAIVDSNISLGHRLKAYVRPMHEIQAEHANFKKFDLTIVCVPTPQLADGSCDTSIVQRVVAEAPTDLVLIKSTVSPGTTRDLRYVTGKRIVFSPEYMGESKYWTPAAYPQPYSPVSHGFCILGGVPEHCSAVADILLPKLGPATRFRFMTSTEAEIVKYAENSFFALKVTFANDLRNICEAADVNYHIVREGWLDDPRVGPMHTAAFKEEPGFDGRCFPKDINALIAYCKKIGCDSTLLQAVVDRNRNLRRHLSQE